MPVSTTKFSVGVPVKDSGSATDPQLHVESGLSQLSPVALAADTSIAMGVTYQVNANNITNKTLRPVFFAVTLEATAGNDYWWNDAENTWTDYGSAFPAGYYDTGSANWIVTHLSKVYAYPSRLETHAIDIPSTPVAGQIRTSLYNVVETQVLSPEEITGVTYYGVQFDIVDGEDTSAGSTQTVVTDNSSGLNRSRDPRTFWLGDGPTDFHRGRITYGGGTRATGWQSGAYSGGATSGLALDNHHATQILAARHRPLKRLSCTFLVDSGNFWPHVPLKFDSVRYSPSYVSVSVKDCAYTVEAVELFTGSYTPVETNNLNPFKPSPPGAGGQSIVQIPLYRDHIWMDAVADGEYGKVLTTSISAGVIILGQTSGDLDDIDDGSTSVKWNASGVPPSATDVGSSGLYMGTDKMGFYDGTEWRTYMDSSGNLNLVDSDGGKTFQVYVAGSPNQLSFSIEAATALGGYVILNGEDAGIMQITTGKDGSDVAASVTMYASGTSGFLGLSTPRTAIVGDVTISNDLAVTGGITLGGAAVMTSWTIQGDTGSGAVTSGETVAFIGGDGVTTSEAGDNITIVVDSTVARTTGNITPSVNNTHDIGSPSAYYANVHAKTLLTDTIGQLTGSITVNANFAANPAANCGTSANPWSAVYTGNVFTALPTSDPSVSGQLWNDSGTVKVS
jgi:hypothetical protein